jgi:hypothetical protein
MPMIMKDERCFSNLRFMKSKLKNRLTTHLDLAVRITLKFFTLNTFSYVAAVRA